LSSKKLKGVQPVGMEPMEPPFQKKPADFRGQVFLADFA